MSFLYLEVWFGASFSLSFVVERNDEIVYLESLINGTLPVQRPYIVHS